MERPLTRAHPGNAFLLLELFLLEQVLEESDLRLEHVHLVDRLLLELIKHLDLSIKSLRDGNVTIQLLALCLELFCCNGQLVSKSLGLILVAHD